MKELSGGGLSGAVQGSKLSGGAYEDSMNPGAAKAAAAGAPAAAGAAVAGGFTLAEARAAKQKQRCRMPFLGSLLVTQPVTSLLPICVNFALMCCLA